MSIVSIIRRVSVLFLCACSFQAESAAQTSTPLDATRRPEERFAVLILGVKDISQSNALMMSDFLRLKMPELFRQTFRGPRNFTAYFKGMQIQQESLDGIDVSTVHRIVIWKAATAPITFKTGGERYVVAIE